MRIMRQHTSQRLFADFPSLAESNPSGDFWAPGYLILSGDDIPPPSLINDFIRQTRGTPGPYRFPVILFERLSLAN